MPKYLYNKKTGCMHIEGYCRCSGLDMLRFDSEDKALAYDGRKVHMCKLCQRESEKRLREGK